MSKSRHGVKDPAKVRAGRLGGKKSSGNFKVNKKGASMAGKRSAWARNSGKLSDYPLGLLDDNGNEVPFPNRPETKRGARS